MARNDKATDKNEAKGTGVQGEELEPIDVVVRHLTRPDGTVVEVEVPVYPPFRLKEGGSPRLPGRTRSVPSVKRKRGGGSKNG